MAASAQALAVASSPTTTLTEATVVEPLDAPTRRWSDMVDELEESDQCYKWPNSSSTACSESGFGKSTDAGSSGGDSEGDSEPAVELHMADAEAGPAHTKLNRAAPLFEPLKTSVMIRSLPCRFNSDKVCETLNKAGLMGRYNAVDTPMNPGGKFNRGYCFVNFKTHQDAQWFMSQWNCFRFGWSTSTKKCEVTW
jgi:hypothetical protein